MRSENSNGKENQVPFNLPRPSWMPAQSQYSGRCIFDSREHVPFGSEYEWSNPLPAKKGRFQLHYLFPIGEVMPVFKGEDELGVKKSLTEVNGYLSPTKAKTQVSINGSPYRETTTPRKRRFDRVAVVQFARRSKTGSKKSKIEYYQEPGNAEARFVKYPPVVNKTPSKISLTPPSKPVKSASRFVTRKAIKEARALRRRSAKGLFNNTSANEIKQAQLPPDENLKAKFALSHIDQVGSGGADIRSQVTVATEGHNLMRLAMAELPQSKLIMDRDDLKGLHYSCKAPLALDDKGTPTHIAGTREVSLWENRLEETSCKIKLNPQSEERPNRATYEMMKSSVSGLFSLRRSDTSREEVIDSDDDDLWLRQ